MQTTNSAAALKQILDGSMNLRGTVKKPARHGESKWIEEKVLLSRPQSAKLLEDANRYMKPSYRHKGAVFTLITSHYFDCAELRFFHQHFINAPKRSRLRILRHAPNGVWSDEAPLIELKSKVAGVTSKKLFFLTPDNYRRVSNGEPMKMTAELLALNPGADKEMLLDGIIEINSLVYEYGLKPSLKIQYKRLAYESADGFRLNMDMNLKIDALDLDVTEVAGTQVISNEVWEKAGQLASKYERKGHFVVEFKHTGGLPQWVAAFMKRNEINTTGFSKYCWAVHKTSGPELAESEVEEDELVLAGAY